MRVLTSLASAGLLLVAASAQPLHKIRGSTAAIAMAPVSDKTFDHQFTAKGDPELVKYTGPRHISLKITNSSEATTLKSMYNYTGGTFEIRVKSAAVMPGVITAVYLSNGDGRKSDEALGDQDEIDLEWKGNEPNVVQTNVFLGGKESLEVIKLKGDSSKTEMLYKIEWTDHFVRFFVDGVKVRAIPLNRPLAPMQLSLSLWTTDGGWPGLLKWGGETDWSTHPEPIEATFEVLSFPY